MIRRWLATVFCAGITMTGAVLAAPHRPLQQSVPFPHDRHANVFPFCTTCHAGVVEPGQPIWPAAARCGSCHDGTVQARVSWQPRSGPKAGNRRFTHDAHDRAVRAHDAGDSALVRTCAACHNEAGSARMQVTRAVVTNCLDCHGLDAPHFDVRADACGTCHVRLTDAVSLARADIERFPAPQSHAGPDFVLGGHGRLARGDGGVIAASCATCHARNLCLECHVNAPESPAIQSLALDARSPDYDLSQPKPSSHDAAGFSRTHQRDARASSSCATCHTRESCASCHAGQPPAAVAALPGAGPERAQGAQLVRRPPSTHTPEFREHHAREANSRIATCETCHERAMCLECHRPDQARSSAYHPRGFIARHPAAAYARTSNCADCHNNAGFCQSCHQQAGVVARARLGRAGYHDGFPGFSLGHGQAARQNLESCVTCHAERDCTACHSTTGGFRFNPHGPGFNADRMQSRAPSMCAACHGRAP